MRTRMLKKRKAKKWSTNSITETKLADQCLHVQDRCPRQSGRRRKSASIKKKRGQKQNARLNVKLKRFWNSFTLSSHSARKIAHFMIRLSSRLASLFLPCLAGFYSTDGCVFFDCNRGFTTSAVNTSCYLGMCLSLPSRLMHTVLTIFSLVFRVFHACCFWFSFLTA